jgi:mannose-6-phosphate isomerase-like protein (cupin superfamily)
MPRKSTHSKSKAESVRTSIPPAASSRSVSRENAEHYRWGDDCDGWHLVKDSQLSVIEELIPPGAAEVRHHHERAQQFFYVLAGEVLMEVEGEMTLVQAGSGIRILPGTKHQIRNPSSSAARFLVVSQPPSHGDRIDE